MAQSFSNIIVHIVFSTKDREPWLTESVRAHLFPYLIAVARDFGSDILCLNGVYDHIHVAVRLNRSTSPAKLVEKLKTSSSKWLKNKFPELSHFAWQSGYGAFSIGASGFDELKAYIQNQEKHHETKTFNEEFEQFLNRYEIPYDERHIWT